MKWCWCKALRALRTFVLALGVLGAGCTRAALAPWVPKLDLRWQCARTRHDPAVSTLSAQRIDVGIAAWLRWSPSPDARRVPERFEDTPAAWLSPCELDDAPCFAELAEAEREIATALQEVP